MLFTNIHSWNGLCAGVVLCGAAAQAEYVESSSTPPTPPREFRGAWIATVANINWPSRPGLTSGAQKAELVALLDRAQASGLNAVIFQVRPAADALYESKYEPWSEYLTGTMGKAPSPFYDPLEFAIQEAHRRNLELHAWFNPFRALHHSSKSEIAPSHISRRNATIVRKYGSYLWLDPGEPGARTHSLRVIMDVVKRYDIDGVHFDDYFYPYPISGSNGRSVPFPDDKSWRRHGNGKLSREDWRRRNVDTFVERVYRSIRSEKPQVKFGISPFGIWRPKHPPQIRGLDAYAGLYADARKWLQNGWVDYMAPQLYWRINPPAQSFPVLLEWWDDQNPKRRHLWPGLNTVKVGEEWPASEILKQIRLSRSIPANSDGHVHWNLGEFVKNRSFSSAIERQAYAEPALVPAFPWMDPKVPPTPRLKITGSKKLRAEWILSEGQSVRQWLLQINRGTKWELEILPASRRSHVLSGIPDMVSIRAVSQCGIFSKPSVLKRK